MKTIKVFLASSDELIEERKEFGFLFCHLNRVFRPRGLYLELVPWEFLDSSMGPLHKQQEYNLELESCEMCMVLYWNKFGEYTYEEFSYAYERLKQGYNPRKLYVFFKEPGTISPELQSFKDRFDENYGHFYCKFETLDALKFEFLVQFEAYQNTNLLTVEESVVKFDNIEITHINNLPFACNDSQLKEYISKVDVVDEKIKLLLELYTVAPDENRKHRLDEAKLEKRKLLEALAVYQQAILHNALQVAKMTSVRIDQCSRDAVEAFKNGDVARANKILQQFDNDEDTSVSNYEYACALMNQEKQNGIVLIDTFLLKASFAMSDSSISLNERVMRADTFYQKAFVLAERFNIETSRKYDILSRYTAFLIDNAIYEKALDNCRELERLSAFDLSEKSKLYNLWGNVYDSLYQHSQALELYNKAYSTISGTDNIIELYNTLTNLGSVMFSLNKHKDALTYYLNAFRTIEGDVFVHKTLFARCYTNIGAVYDALGNWDKALECHKRAFELYEDLYGLSDINIAICHNNIGTTILKTDPVDALRHFSEALNVCNKIKGYYHPTTSVCYMNMGQGYEAVGEYDAALSCYEKAHDIRIRVFGNHHEIIATTSMSIGAVYYLSGEYEQALKVYEDAARICKNQGQKAEAEKYISYIKALMSAHTPNV